MALRTAHDDISTRVIFPLTPPPCVPQDNNERLWKEQAIYEASSHVKFLLKTHFEEALRHGKTPVFTNFSCTSKWVQHSEVSRSGILDHRVLETPDGALQCGVGGGHGVVLCYRRVRCFVALTFVLCFASRSQGGATRARRRAAASPTSRRGSLMLAAA